MVTEGVKGLNNVYTNQRPATSNNRKGSVFRAWWRNAERQ